MDTESSIVIDAHNLAVGYMHGKKALRTVYKDLNFALYKGELTCLIGANGIGKSTLLRTLSASQPVMGGDISVYLSGEKESIKCSLSSLSEKELSRQISVVLTDKTQAGGLTVKELVALGRQPHTGFFGRLHQYDKKIIARAIKQVGIMHRADCYVAELSDGERQKVMIAKALVQESPIIILDEPTAFLDVVSRIEIMSLLHRLAMEDNKAILLSTHDIEQALVLSDRLWLMSDKGFECGVTEDMIFNKKLDILFNDKNINFDYAHGVYYPKVHADKNIIVYASDKTLLHWAINALNRNGYMCQVVDDIQDIKGGMSLKVLSSCRLLLCTDKEKEYTSFEQLFAALP